MHEEKLLYRDYDVGIFLEFAQIKKLIEKRFPNVFTSDGGSFYTDRWQHIGGIKVKGCSASLY